MDIQILITKFIWLLDEIYMFYLLPAQEMTFANGLYVSQTDVGDNLEMLVTDY